MSGFAGFKRDIIVERTQEGKVIARQRNDFREGRPPKFTKKQIQNVIDLPDTHSYKQVEEITMNKQRAVDNNQKKELSSQFCCIV